MGMMNSKLRYANSWQAKPPAAVILMIVAVLAMVIANSPLSEGYSICSTPKPAQS